ncbi:HAMP domain-containing protein [Microbacterium sp. NEAU-LLC]|uniref:histidine kinase n=1 Tax=Microbacterium helvum TaxID=2773713 RepID=A0ABR8NP47_9MICO|nr:HAMP domain-containing protein [Microbacterium helvum]
MAASAPPRAGDEATSAKKERLRRPWTLQRKLIATVVSITSFILVLVAVATSAILAGVLEAQLDSDVKAARQSVDFVRGYIVLGQSAEEILQQQQPRRPGYFLAVGTSTTDPSAAVVDEDGDVVPLTAAQIEEIDKSLSTQHGQFVVTVEDLGTYRIEGVPVGGNAFAIVGLSRAGVSATMTRMLTTIALLTVGGLILLTVATAWTIRVGLAPLRAVADTADRVSNLKLDQGAVSITERVPDAEADPRTEVGRVGAALNSLLDHVDESLTARQRNEERMRAFVADASHELRTPLASIRGYSELSLKALGRALRQAETPDAGTIETTESSLERIQAQSLRMTSLVEDLLLLARLDEGQELVYGSVDLTRLAIDAVGDIRTTAAEHDWVLEVGEEPVTIAGDAGRLQQVITNLLANARTHTPAGTVVTVRVAREGSNAVLIVHDDGPGVDPAIKDELFERFSRADRSRARQTGGTGLGLSIARAIVDAHGGSIHVDSAPGDTTFEVRLPARPTDAA